MSLQTLGEYRFSKRNFDRIPQTKWRLPERESVLPAENPHHCDINATRSLSFVPHKEHEGRHPEGSAQVEQSSSHHLVVVFLIECVEEREPTASYLLSGCGAQQDVAVGASICVHRYAVETELHAAEVRGDQQRRVLTPFLVLTLYISAFYGALSVSEAADGGVVLDELAVAQITPAPPATDTRP